MAITPENLPKHELIGLKISVVKSTDKTQVGLQGQIIGETRNTIIVQTSKGEKTVQKKGAVFKILLNGSEIEVDGDQLIKNPIERTKTLVKKW
jgi:ribonuclease P protein subunit POP4|tara:strand:- start:447 stop:725 length:279 start_codon:yes stop_codon:yes gene_type:complete